MADSSKFELKKPTFKKVSELRPLDTGLSLTVKVIDAKAVVPRGRQMRTTECLVGDETRIIVFVARNDQGGQGQDPWVGKTMSGPLKTGGGALKAELKTARSMGTSVVGIFFVWTSPTKGPMTTIIYLMEDTWPPHSFQALQPLYNMAENGSKVGNVAFTSKSGRVIGPFCYMGIESVTIVF